ncbi:DUF2267 domain-containing protein [Tunicatimonas pelagia]|uniref:DUF2267 domain-containing protein n=1 Tax=Tunicatimonas pelagia TaxID=931531 RepID=UPI0026652570|nr:DUF2267 domain-containing protein [Tunicatimonas pelagia]WKN43396.1 DUF2267 domain-containing protein [Tunicatimonas pelagia]
MNALPRYQPHLIYLSDMIVPIARYLGFSENTEQALTLVESLLSTICRILPFSKAVQFFTPLPLPLQALIAEHWKVDQYLPSPIHSFPDLLHKIVSADQQVYSSDEIGTELVKRTLLATMKAVSNHVSPEEMKQIISVFPDDAQERIDVYIQME